MGAGRHLWIHHQCGNALRVYQSAVPRLHGEERAAVLGRQHALRAVHRRDHGARAVLLRHAKPASGPRALHELVYDRPRVRGEPHAHADAPAKLVPAVQVLGPGSMGADLGGGGDLLVRGMVCHCVSPFVLLGGDLFGRRPVLFFYSHVRLGSMRISFVIPAYNEEALLPKCLTALTKELRATEHRRHDFDAEIIVVNNTSTDRTKEIAQSYPEVKVVDEAKKGLVWARRAGLVVSQGELIANIDADTMLPSGWIDTMLDEFSRDTALVALSGPFIYYDLSAFSQVLVRIFYAMAYMNYLFAKHVFGVGAMLQGGNFVIRKDVFQKIGGFDTSIEFYGEDTDVARRLSAVGKVKWTFKFPMYSSGRRARKEGLVWMSFRYTLNYFWVTFTKKPLTHEHIDIRPEENGEAQ
jgi:glycosyltransferase involved in cell wall biosynthesis